MVAFYGALAGADRATPRPVRTLRLDADRRRGATQAGLDAGALLGLRAGRRVRAGQALAGRALCGAGALAARATSRCRSLLLGSAERSRAVRGDRRRGAAAPAACSPARPRSIDAIALIAGARGMVSNDSGLMHVAAAFGVPQAAVFGSTSPMHTPPLNPRARVLWLKDELGLDCMPCFDRTCRFGHYRCLIDVAPERVERALDARGTSARAACRRRAPARSARRSASRPAAPG